MDRRSLDHDVETEKDLGADVDENGDILDSDARETETMDSPAHLVPFTVLEGLDTLIDEKKARDVAESQYPHTPLGEMGDNTLRAVAYEGMVLRSLEDKHGPKQIAVHPKGLTLSDGCPIEPDFAVTDENGDAVELHDAKAYSRKDTRNPEASASSLTHMPNLKHAARYVDVADSNVKSVTFDMPQETASMSAVQDEVAKFGREQRSVDVQTTGSEAELKQRMDDIRTAPEQRFALSEHIIMEVGRIQSLPAQERREAMGDLVLSLRDTKGEETADGRNLRWSTTVERDGKAVSVTDPTTGHVYTVSFG